jgi:hypothetical protein
MPDISREHLDQQIQAYDKRAQECLVEHQRYVGAAAALRQLIADIDSTNHAEPVKQSMYDFLTSEEELEMTNHDGEHETTDA